MVGSGLRLGADGRYELRDPDGRLVVSAVLTDYDGRTWAAVLTQHEYLLPYVEAVIDRIAEIMPELRELSGDVVEARPDKKGGARGTLLEDRLDWEDKLALLTEFEENELKYGAVEAARMAGRPLETLRRWQERRNELKTRTTLDDKYSQVSSAVCYPGFEVKK